MYATMTKLKQKQNVYCLVEFFKLCFLQLYCICETKAIVYGALSTAKTQVTYAAVLCLNASCVNTDSCCCCSAILLLSPEATCVDIVFDTITYLPVIRVN